MGWVNRSTLRWYGHVRRLSSDKLKSKYILVEKLVSVRGGLLMTREEKGGRVNYGKKTGLSIEIREIKKKRQCRLKNVLLPTPC